MIRRRNPWYYNEFLVTVVGMTGVILVATGIVWFAAAQEARSYNKFCETPVTTWDAVWLDLRIDECTK